MNPATIRTVLTIASHALAAGAKAVDAEPSRAAEHPNDAKLLALEQAYNAYDAEQRAHTENASGDERDRLLRIYVERKEAVLDAMHPIPADTLAGTAAKARVTSTHRTDNLRGNDTASDLQADALDDIANPP